MKEIALKAVELALLLRASKVGYSWEQIPYKTPFNPTEMEIMESLDEASISDPSMTRVAFTVFGSVVKTGGITEGERVVLQKAEVVVKKM